MTTTTIIESAKIAHVHVRGKKAASLLINEMVGETVFDLQSTSTAGYTILRKADDYMTYVCNLGDRYEINFSNGKTLNIWIEPLKAKVRKLF